MPIAPRILSYGMLRGLLVAAERRRAEFLAEVHLIAPVGGPRARKVGGSLPNRTPGLARHVDAPAGKLAKAAGDPACGVPTGKARAYGPNTCAS
jgi:hypothetical protein